MLIGVGGIIAYLVFGSFLAWAPDDGGNHIGKNLLTVFLIFWFVLSLYKIIYYIFKKRYLTGAQWAFFLIIFFASPFVIKQHKINAALDKLQFTRNETYFDKMVQGNDFMTFYLGIRGNNLTVLAYDSSEDSNTESVQKHLGVVPADTEIIEMKPHYYHVTTYIPGIYHGDASARIGEVYGQRK